MAMMSLKHAWEFIINLFDFRNLDNILREEIPKGKGRYGVPNFGAGILLFLFSLFILSLISIVLAIFAHGSLPPGFASVTPRPELTYGFFASSLIYFGAVMFPYLMIGSFIYQGFAFLLLRILGSKGDFRKQYFITSFIALALGIGSLGSIITMPFLFFLPCISLFFFLVYFAAAVYLVFFVQTKMICEIHRAKPIVALIVVLIASIGSLAAFVVVQLIVEHYGLFPDFTATFGFPQLNQTITDLNVSMPQVSGFNMSTNEVANVTAANSSSG